jgi:hypothetical protein
MEHQSQIHFIGGEKGGVGKSVVARLMAQYWIDQNKHWSGFDTDRSHGALLRYYSDFSQELNINQVEALDRIVETAVETKSSVLVDLAAQTEAILHNWIEDGSVLDMATELGIGLYFWYVVDDGKDSINLLSRLFKRYGGSARYVIVLNHGRGEDFTLLNSSQVMQQMQDINVPVIKLKGLHKPSMRKIDQFDKSFWAAINNNDPAQGECLGMMERQRVKTWLKNVYGEFERIGI